MADELEDDFYGKRVQVVRFEKHDYASKPELVFREEYRSGEFGGEEEAYLSKSAQKALKGAKAGDIVEIEFDYNRFPASIPRARRVTGTPAEQIRLLTERVETLVAVIDGIPDVIRKAADAVGGDRYEEAKRVQHAVARALEDHIQRGGKAVVDPVLLYRSGG